MSTAKMQHVLYQHHRQSEGEGLVEGMVLECEMGYWQVKMMDTRDGTTVNVKPIRLTKCITTFQ